MFNSVNAVVFNRPVVIRYDHLRLLGLPLPNDELWHTTNSSKRRALPSSDLHPISFWDGLQNLFIGKPVATQYFGHVILMAGLLNKGRLDGQYDSQLRFALNSWNRSVRSTPKPTTFNHGVQVLYHIAQMDVHSAVDRPRATFHALKFLLSVL